MARLNKAAIAGPDADSDSDLVEAARSGNRHAFGTLVERYQAPVCSLGYALTGSFALSEEIAQEAFIVCWQRLGHFRNEGTFRAFLFGITQNVCRNVRRKQHTRLSAHVGPSPLENNFPAEGPTPLESLISKEEEGLLWRALERVPEFYRIPLITFYWQEQSVESVASALGVTQRAVKQRLWRGRKCLRQEIMPLMKSVLTRARPGKRLTAAVAVAIAGIAGGGAVPAAASTGAPATRLMSGAKAFPLLASAVILPLLLLGAPRLGRREATPDSPRTGKQTSPTPRFAAGAATADQHDGTSGAAPATPGGEPVLRLDFEDGLLPAGINGGHVVPGPPRPGSQYAIMATIWAWYPTIFTVVSVETFKTSYRPTLVIEFDYWAGSDSRILVVEVNDATKGRSYGRAVAGLERGVWRHAMLRLSAFESNLNPRYAALPATAMEEGDEIKYLTISGGRVGGQPLYVDNIEVSDYAPAQLARVSEGIAPVF